MTTATSSLVLAAALTVVTTAPVRAQKPEAESLFREGKALLKKGDIAEACAKFEASEKVEPAAGTELSLADCREQNKQTATAWAMFLKAAATAKKAGDTRRGTEAKRRAKLLEPKLKYLTIKVPEKRRVEGLEITRDGDEVDPAVWNQRVPVDPGTHDIKAKAPGRATWKEQVEIEKSDEVVEVPMLEEVASEPTDEEGEPKSEPEKKTGRKSVDKKPVERVASTGRRYKAAAVTFAVMSATGLGIGTFYGLRARSRASDADAICPTTSCLDPVALDLNKQARSAALYANVGFAVGGAALLGTVILLVKGRARSEKVAVVPTAGKDEVGIALGGRF